MFRRKGGRWEGGGEFVLEGGERVRERERERGEIRGRVGKTGLGKTEEGSWAIRQGKE